MDLGKYHHTNLVEDGSLCLGALLEGPADAAVPADGDEHEVEDGYAAGQHVARLVEDAPALGERPAAWATQKTDAVVQTADRRARHKYLPKLKSASNSNLFLL